jgi:hypothetical protein
MPMGITMKISIKTITYTALFLALTIAFQQFKALNQFITGPIVNAILIISTLYIGLACGSIIAFLSPISAVLINPSPLMLAVPMMTPLIIIGNLIIVFSASYYKDKNLAIGLTLGSVLKALFLWIGVSYVVLPYFGAGLAPKLKMLAQAAFSYNQLITALVGSLIAYLIWLRLKRIPK